MRCWQKILMFLLMHKLHAGDSCHERTSFSQRIYGSYRVMHIGRLSRTYCKNVARFYGRSIFQFPHFNDPLLADTTFSFTTRIAFTKIIQVNFPTAGLWLAGNVRLYWIFGVLMLKRSIHCRVSRFLPFSINWMVLNMSFVLCIGGARNFLGFQTRWLGISSFLKFKIKKLA